MDTLTLPDTQAALAWALKAYKTHGRRYSEYRQYMDGDEDVHAVIKKLQAAYGREIDKFIYNRCAAVVDAHADRMQVAGFGSNDDDERKKARQEAAKRGEAVEDDGLKSLAQIAEETWNANQMDVREGMVETDMFGLGDGYVIVEVDPKDGSILIWPQYAENIRVKYSDIRPGVITQAARRWYDDDLRKLRLNLYFADRIEKYASVRTFTEYGGIDWNVKDWEPYQPEGDTAWPVVLNITDTVPVFHFGNNARVNAYGTSELKSILDLQDHINQTLNNMSVAMEFYATPQRWVAGVDLDDTSTTSIQRIQAGIDRMLVLTGADDDRSVSVGQFAAASMEPYIDVIEHGDQMISRVSFVPSRYLNQESTQESGISKRMDESPFVSKIEDRQRASGSVWADGVMRYCLRLQGLTVEPGDIRVNWKPAAPLSEDQVWELVTMKVTAGMPFAAALREAGYEPEQIADIMADREAEQRAAMVADFGGGVEDDEDQEAT